MLHRSRLLIAGLLLLTTGCGSSYRTYAPPGDIAHEERPLKMHRLGEDGESYTRRANLYHDISRLGPRDGETYDSYRKRMAYTLHMQEVEMNRLEAQIEVKQASVGSLQSQIAEAERHQTEMRLAISGHTNYGDDDSAPIRSEIPFYRYSVESGDTLQSISHDHYGTYTGWLALYRLNHKSLPNGPNQIEVGTTLLLPNVR